MRRSDILNLVPTGSIIVELGVAQGELSEALLGTGLVGHLYSIDAWAGDRRHDYNEYAKTCQRLAPYSDHNTIMRMTFDEALDHFEDNSIDLVYVDGYAHTGQNNGKTIRDWYAKVKPGGIISGDDYNRRWQPTIDAVNKFISDYDLQLHILKCADPSSKWGKSNSWYARKPTLISDSL